MKVTGSATLHAPREKVWQALNDPAVLVRTIPGCQRLEETGPDQYTMTLFAGVASIKGTYTGQVRLTDQQQPGSFVLRASGAGAPGTVQADVTVTLAENGGSTLLSYDADAIVGGMVGGVGQRMLTGVAKKTAGEFFSAVDDVLTGAAPAGAPEVPGAVVPAGGPTGGVAASPGVYRAPVVAGAGGPLGSDFVRGAVFGAAVALLGAVVGGWASRRR
ncbi:MAG: SRPBCC family protein [Actinomycetes bacterium]